MGDVPYGGNWPMLPAESIAAPAVPQRGMRTFRDGERIANRYQVIRFVARGGVGEVYEVEDLELHARVALKTLRPELADDDAVLARFRREISLSRKVTHPNVCRVFDLGLHPSPAGWVTFLTMELLEGETLRRRIQRTGPLSLHEALPIVRQVAAGLSAAHADGVVHRDLKSDNVMLAASAEGGVRAVVTDFGLARSTEMPEVTTGALRGTPAYMAPEQVSGGAVGPWTDVYALGVVIYEMITGALPFRGDSPMAIAVRRLNTRAPSPRTVVPDLPPCWERAILRCLEREPRQRFASVTEVAAALRDPAAPAPRRIAFPVVAAAVVIAAAAAWWLHAQPVRSSAVAERAPSRRSVAVLGMRNLSQQQETAWLGTALAELLSSEVSGGGQLRRIPPETVTRARRELTLPEDAQLDPETLRRLRDTVHADYVLGGSYLALGNADKTLRVEVRLQDTRTGEVIASQSETGTEATLFALVSRAGTQLRASLGVGALDPRGEAEARSALPADPRVARAYAEGLSRLRLLDALGARPLLEEATRAEPAFPLAHAALSEVFHQLGQKGDEEREARLAWEHAAGLNREQQLLVEGRLRVAQHEWPRAIEVYRSLHEFYPSTIDYGLELAQVQVRGGRPRDALDTVDQLRRSAQGAERDPRVDIVEAHACGETGQFERQDAVARRAAEKARALGASELEGDALLHESSAADMLGDRVRAGQRASQAVELFRQIGNRNQVGHALLRRANASWRTGDLPGARALFLEARDVFARLGSENDLARAMHGFANIEADMGHRTQALAIYREALPIYQHTGNLLGVEAMYTNIGQQLAHLGQLDAAEASLLRALELTRQLGERHAEGIVYESLGGLYLDRGEPERALHTLEHATAIAREIHDATTTAQTRRKQGESLLALGRYAEAEQAFKDGIGQLDAMGEVGRSGDGKLRLALLYLDLGRLDDAEAAARAAVEQHARAQVDSGEASASLARVLAVRGKLEEARDAARRALERTPDALGAQLAVASVELAEHHPRRALARLTKALARGPAQAPERLEAQLLLGRALEAAGRGREGRAQLARVAAEAKRRGFVAVEKAATH